MLVGSQPAGVVVRSMGIDFGTKHIGVAIGENSIGLVQPLCTLAVTRHPEGVWNQLQEIIRRWHIQLAVVGLPLQSDGTEQLITQCARRFAGELVARYGLPVVLQDERLSSIEARSYVLVTKKKRGRHGWKRDSIAAALILQSWLDEQRRLHGAGEEAEQDE